MIEVRELVGGVGNNEYCTVYSGTGTVLVAVGLARCDQLPSAPGDTKSGGYKGYKRNPRQRWKVRRRGRDLFDVYLWHELCPTRPAFEQFMRQAMQRGPA